MSIPPLNDGVVTVTHADSNKNKQINIAAEKIWGLTDDKLPQPKYDELNSVLVDQLKKDYGNYTVQGFRDTFVLFPNQSDLENSIPKPCSLGTCMVTDAAKKCGRCMKARYCSQEHQKKDWSRHKFECISPPNKS